MKRRLTAKLLLAAVAIAPIASVPANVATAQTVTRPTSEIVLSIGRGELLTVPGDMADIFIANEGVADVQLKSQNQLYIFGKGGGETTIYASNARGDIIWSANVRVGTNIDSMDQMLALAMPEAKITASTMGTNTVLLTGTVAAPEDAAEAERLVQAFVGDANVISRLRTATPLQVNLQVRFAEVSRSLLRTLGGSLSSTRFDSNGFRIGVGTGRSVATGNFDPAGPLAVGPGAQNPTLQVFDPATGQVISTITGPGISTTGSGGTIGAAGRLLGLDLLGALDVAEQSGLSTTLSQPNLTALSGETAEFLAGGEFPIPTSQGLGTTAVEYRKYGVSLAYTPTVLANGRISIRVAPEVSELSSQGAVVLNGFQIPALTIRRAETTVELGSGQSFMIAGLMSNNSQSAISKMPGAGDLPIIGNLFRSSSFRKGETELVIVVTPYLVQPVNARDIALPTDAYENPNVLEQWLGFQDQAGKSGGSRPMPTVQNQDAPPPSVSRIDPQAVLPAQASNEEDSKNNRKRKKRERSAKADATPGFSLK